jgi:hypothetical protein
MMSMSLPPANWKTQCLVSALLSYIGIGRQRNFATTVAMKAAGAKSRSGTEFRSRLNSMVTQFCFMQVRNLVCADARLND